MTQLLVAHVNWK